MITKFEWDDEKADKNLRKHGVAFETAARVFSDPLCFSRQDRFENGEERWQTLGVVQEYLLLLVAHTIRDEENGVDVIRIISARRANAVERRRYEKENREL